MARGPGRAVPGGGRPCAGRAGPRRRPSRGRAVTCADGRGGAPLRRWSAVLLWCVPRRCGGEVMEEYHCFNHGTITVAEGESGCRYCGMGPLPEEIDRLRAEVDRWRGLFILHADHLVQCRSRRGGGCSCGYVKTFDDARASYLTAALR